MNRIVFQYKNVFRFHRKGIGHLIARSFLKVWMFVIALNIINRGTKVTECLRVCSLKSCYPLDPSVSCLRITVPPNPKEKEYLGNFHQSALSNVED